MNLIFVPKCSSLYTLSNGILIQAYKLFFVRYIKKKLKTASHTVKPTKNIVEGIDSADVY